MKCIHVKWHDATSTDAWTEKHTILPEVSVVETIGFLVTESKDVIVLSLNHDTTNDNCSCFISIPKSCIFYRASVSI